MPSLSNTLKSIGELGLRPTLAYLAYQAGKRSGWYRLAGRPVEESESFAVAALRLGRSEISPPAAHDSASQLEPQKHRRPAVVDPASQLERADDPTSQLERAVDPASQLDRADDPALTQLDRLQHGRVRVFGRVDLPLDFTWAQAPGHWTDYDRGLLDGQDIKFIWEPARFCWAADLARLARVQDPAPLRALLDSRVAEFMSHNPPYQGPHWASAQEAALRLIHLALGRAALGDCLPDFGRIIAVHARRIPLTLAYARAQDNNHLLSEAAGLFTAGVLLPDHPDAGDWHRTGWTTFNRAVLRQFAPDGAYMQQSTNYHRLALTLAVWMAHLAGLAGEEFPMEVRDRLGAAVRWLRDRCDPATGAVPNLGANDGAHILPLSPQPYADFRPVVQAAARAFLGGPVYDPGPWDELGDWLPPETGQQNRPAQPDSTGAPRRTGQIAPAPARPTGTLQTGEPVSPALVHPDLPSRAYLRAVAYHSRPGHADQLHLDLWWQGINIARDPGTYSYNAEPPWQNALQTAHHHNTLTIDGLDQMTLAGRFLYVDRATGRVLEDGRAADQKGFSGSDQPHRRVAEHNGYRRLGLVHRRTVEAVPEGWRVRDEIAGVDELHSRPGRHLVRIHWLLPDWEWSFENGVLQLISPHGPLALETQFPSDAAPVFSLVRAGEVLLGPPAAATRGWFSPTYAVKEPALSFAAEAEVEVPVEIESVWGFD